MTQSRTEVLILNQQDVKRLLDIPDMLDALERAFVAFSAGKASVPPRVAARAERGLLGVMPGYLPGVALEAKIVSVFPANHEQGRPSHQGLIALFDEDDGTPLAIMDGIYVTAIRTGGGAAVSARALARKDSRVLTILGAGAQGHSHLATLPLVREFEEIRIASRNQPRADDLAAENPGARVVENFYDAVTGADVVCCCTDAREPIIDFSWLKPGAHVTSVGGTFGREIDPQTIDRGSVFVEWRGASENPPPAGASELQGISPESLTEMGEVLSGIRPGRQSDDEITVYKSTGHAVEDAATARMVYDRALKEGAGIRVSF